jgi:hypothetical protein
MSELAAAADAPDPGSIHFYAELYAPPQRRALLRAVHALESGVRASLRPGLDHQVAHVRLSWWQQEAERAGAGAPSHPLAGRLQAAAGTGALAAALRDWVQATQAELAGELALATLRGKLAEQAGASRFGLVAACLDADDVVARALGAATTSLAAAGAGAATARAAMLSQLEALAPASQRPLRPLLVWSVLGLRRARCGETSPPERAAAAPLVRLGDNLVAWRAARAADAGRIRRILRS